MYLSSNHKKNNFKYLTVAIFFRSSEFPTSKLEMERVADLFDRDGQGQIDYQEFIAALRPDWEKKGGSWWH